MKLIYLIDLNFKLRDTYIFKDLIFMQHKKKQAYSKPHLFELNASVATNGATKGTASNESGMMHDKGTTAS